MHELIVEGMTCGGCAASVTRAVRAVDRDAGVDVELEAKRVRVRSGAALDAVRSAIDDAGFTVTEARTT